MQNLIYLIPILPLLAFALIVLFANQEQAVQRIAGNRHDRGIFVGDLVVGVLHCRYHGEDFAHHPIELPGIMEIPTGTVTLHLGFTVDTLTSNHAVYGALRLSHDLYLFVGIHGHR